MTALTCGNMIFGAAIFWNPSMSARTNNSLAFVYSSFQSTNFVGVADTDLFPYRAITMTINAMISVRLVYFMCMFIVMVLYGSLLISLQCCKGGDKAKTTHSNIAPKLFLVNKFVSHSYSAYNLTEKKLPDNCEICIENFKSYPEKLIGEVPCS